MLKRRIMLPAILLVLLLALSATAAADNTTDDIAGIEETTDEITAVTDENEDIIISDDADSDIIAAQDDEVISSSESDEKLEMTPSEIKEKTIDPNPTIELAKNESFVSKSVKDDAEKLSMRYSNANVYLKYVKTHYNSGKYLYLGWSGYFDGYFKVYKGHSLYYKEYIYGYNQDLQWSLRGMSPGTYVAKLVDYYGDVMGKTKIVILKSYSKIKVKSFSAKAGTTFYCYAYVKDKFTGNKYNGGTVKFYIAGKVYKAKLKSGVAIAKIKIPKKIKKYRCKAKFMGGTNVHGKTTHFKMTVKKAPKISYKRFKGKSKYSWKIPYKTWNKMKKQARSNYNFFRSKGSGMPGYSDRGVKVTVKKAGHRYSGIAYAVKNDWGIRCEVRCVKPGLRISNWGDYYV